MDKFETLENALRNKVETVLKGPPECMKNGYEWKFYESHADECAEIAVEMRKIDPLKTSEIVKELKKKLKDNFNGN
jgi:hypothetical protein